ncbi:MAG: rod shape-determining protein MreC [Patescibacteria group bacterium]
MNNKNDKLLRIFVAVFGLLIFLNAVSLLDPIRSSFSNLFDTFMVGLKRTSDNISLMQMNKAELIDKIEGLEIELSKERVDLANLYSVQSENEQLLNFFNFFDKNNFNNYVLADVVWEDSILTFSSTNKNLVINRGSDDGISPGLAVLNEEGVLVGKVVEVNSDYSKICLSSNSFCNFAVSISNNDGSSGMSEGNLGMSIRVNYIAQNEDVQVGDIVYTSGLERSIPRGLYVGEVINIEKSENDIWQNVSAEPLFDFKNINKVSVLLIN